MSEPRKINIGGGHRAPSNAQNVYHAGDAQAASGRSVNTGASAAHSDDAAREAARRRYEQQRAASQRGYEDARLEEARARARADAEAARLRRSQQFPRVQQAPTSGARVQHLDLSRTQGSKPMYDINNDAEFEARQRRRAQAQAQAQAAQAAQQRTAAPARSAQPAQSAQPQRQINRSASAASQTGRTIHRSASGQAAARGTAQTSGQPAAQAASAAAAAAAAQASRGSAGRTAGGAGSSSARAGAAYGSSAGGKPPKGPGRGKKGGDDGGSGKGKGGKRKRKVTWWKILLGTVLVIALIFAGTIGVIMNAIRPKGGSVSINELINTPKGLDGQQLNILVLGVDRSAQGGDMAAGSTNDSEANDGNTDMIMYVQLDFVNNEVRMLQIPRNILVTTDYNVSHNYQINNVAITQGSDGNNNYDALATLINEQLGLYIDGYVAIRLEALVELVDTLGPIQVYVPEEITYTDDYGNVTSHLDQGLQWMDGPTAEFFLRARKTYAQSDIQRLNVQRYFYSAMFARLRAMTVWDIAKILPVVMNYMETDLPISQLVSAAVSLLSVSSDHIMLCQVPVYMGQLYYNNNDIDVIYRQGTADLLNQYFRTPETQVAAEDLKICDNVVDVGNRTPTDPNVQYMGALNQDVIDSANESGVATDPNATYDLPAETPAPEEGSESTDSSDSSSEETDDAA